MDRSDVAELVQRCAENYDPELWDQFIDQFEDRLQAGVRRALARCDLRLAEQDREDLLQDVYCRLLERRRRCMRMCKGSEMASVGAYFGKVAENVVLDRLRSRSAVKRGRDLLVDPGPDSMLDPVAEAPDHRADPEQRLLARERQRAFLRLFRGLLGSESPQRDWTVFRMAVLEGWSSREICEQVGGTLKPSTVDSLIHRLRRRLLSVGVHLPRRSPAGETRDRLLAR